MKKINELITKKQLIYIAFTLAGFLAGWAIFGGNAGSTGNTESTASHDGHNHAHELVQDEKGVWTCSMHPQIRQDKPGKCPICAMDLIPLRKSSGGDESIDPAAIQLSEEAAALADVQTSEVSRENPVKKIRLYGKIAPDERSLQSQTAYVGGRIENLNIDFTGETVHVGQTLATLYSPELFTAQQELLEASKMQQPQLVQAAREKLRLWKMTDPQIDAVLQLGTAAPTVEIKANTNGIVLSKRVSKGDYISQGAVLFDVVNLAEVWAMFDAFEVDLPFLSKGDKVDFTLPAFPGKKFTGKISFIDPIINATTRTARVRVDVANPRQELKPEMYATAEVNAPMKGYRNQLVVPQSAILWTGKRAIVYVRQPGVTSPAFLMREVELGPSLGGAYIVLSGLTDGEEIVTNGVFSIDASAQLEGKTSMMNRVDATAKPITGHAPHQKESMNNNATDKQASKHTMFGAKGACDMCKERIEKAALSVAGVQSAHWDKDSQTVHLQFDTQKTNADAIAKAIAKSGHDTDKYKADDAIYNQLPGCCKYRN